MYRKLSSADRAALSVTLRVVMAAGIQSKEVNFPFLPTCINLILVNDANSWSSPSAKLNSRENNPVL